MKPIPAELRRAIDRLYGAFKSIPRPRKMHGDMEVLPASHPFLAKDLRALTALDFRGDHFCRNYWWKARTSMGDESDYQRLLPRMMELLVLAIRPDGLLDGSIDGEVDAVLGRLRYEFGDRSRSWTRWGEKETEAVRGFLHALWDAVRRLEPPAMREEPGARWQEPDMHPPVNRWLAAMVAADPDVGWYLQRWVEDPDRRSRANLAACVLSVGRFVDRTEETVRAWLKSDAVRAALTRWAEEAWDTADGPLLAGAAEQTLRWAERAQ